MGFDWIVSIIWLKINDSVYKMIDGVATTSIKYVFFHFIGWHLVKKFNKYH
jgi:hypothetical protein